MEYTPKTTRWIHNILVPVVSVFCAGMFIAVFGQVIFRYVLNKPLPWSEELARYLMVWIASLGAVEAYGSGGHVGVNALSDSLSPVPRKYLHLFVHLAVGILMAVIVYQGFKLSFLLWDQESPAMSLRMTWPYLAVPVGAALMLVQALALFYHIWKLPPQEAAIVCGPRETP